MRHRMNRLALAALLLAVSPAAAQLEKVGYVTTSFKNPTSSGSSSLAVQVHYPATSSGKNATLKTISGGWPVVVFLQGFTVAASSYTRAADYIAARGYVVVINDTQSLNPDGQAADGIAQYSVVASENANSSGFFKGALDPKRVGLAGHSMGGGTTVRVLASNPGYLAGVSLAPWDLKLLFNRDYPKSYAPKVTVPLTIVHGQGDTTVAWSQGKAFYDQATAYRKLKTMYLFNSSGGHSNVAGTAINNTTDQAIFDRSMSVLVGFMDTYVKNDTTGLENVLGPTARGEPYLSQITHDIEQTELWLTGSTTLGSKFTMQALVKPGAAVLAVGLRNPPLNTVFGPFVLNPAAMAIVNQAPASNTCLQTTPLQIPNSAGLKGLSATFQGLGSNTPGALRLTGGVDVKIQ